jgi:hypothetical protein
MQKHLYWGYCAGKPAQQGGVMGDAYEKTKSRQTGRREGEGEKQTTLTVATHQLAIIR